MGTTSWSTMVKVVTPVFWQQAQAKVAKHIGFFATPLSVWGSLKMRSWVSRSSSQAIKSFCLVLAKPGKSSSKSKTNWNAKRKKEKELLRLAKHEENPAWRRLTEASRPKSHQLTRLHLNPGVSRVEQVQLEVVGDDD